MFIKMLKDRTVSTNGWNQIPLLTGERYEVSDALARGLIAQEHAVELEREEVFREVAPPPLDQQQGPRHTETIQVQPPRYRGNEIDEQAREIGQAQQDGASEADATDDDASREGEGADPSEESSSDGTENAASDPEPSETPEAPKAPAQKSAPKKAPAKKAAPRKSASRKGSPRK